MKSMRPTITNCLVIGAALIAFLGDAQASSSGNDTVDARSRARIVNALAEKMRSQYVFPEIGIQTERALKKKLNDGGYDSLKYSVGLASELTRDLQAVAHDVHLRVDYGAPLGAGAAHTAAQEAERLKILKAANYGVGGVERLPGNIGYFEMTSFAPLKFSRASISAAMSQLADCDALILDMRKNRGGDPETVSWVSSYLFDKRTHLNDLYWRDGNRTQQFWTNDKVLGPKFGQSKPIYVLTSGATFSAAEEMSYNLKVLKRATIVGKVTGGGAHPGAFVPLSADFMAFIPSGRAINPITKTNWEGSGVTPDIIVQESSALLEAQRLAIQTLSEAQKDPQKLAFLLNRLTELKTQ